MIGAMLTLARLLAVAVFAVVVIATLKPLVTGEAKSDGRLTTIDGDTVEIGGEARAAGLTFAPGVTAADRAWILESVARARPEAARLVAEVDGLIVVGTFAAGGSTLGVTRSHERGFTVDLNVAYLNGESVADRSTVVLHELGHVIDFAIVPKTTNA